MNSLSLGLIGSRAKQGAVALSGMARALRRLGARFISTASMLNLAAGLILLAGAAIALTIWSFRSEALREAQSHAFTLSAVLAERAAGEMQAVDLSLRQVQDYVAHIARENPAGLHGALTDRQMHVFLRDSVAALASAGTLELIGTGGSLLNTSRSWPPPATTDPAPYDLAAASRDPGLYIGEPGRTAGQPTQTVVYLARRILGPDGSPIGVVHAALPLPLAELNRPAAHLGNAVISLARTDGSMVLGEPANGEPRILRIPAASPWHRIVANGGGLYQTASDFGHEPRIVAVHPLGPLALVVNVSVDPRALVANWQRQAFGVVVGTLIVALYSMVLLHALKAKSHELEVTLNNMAQGIIVSDPQRRVPVINRQAVKLLGLPDRFVQESVSFDEIVDFQRSCEEFGKDGTAVNQKIWDSIRSGGMAAQFPVYERTRPNGTALEIRTVCLADGTLVRTYTDVTERKNAEDVIRHMAFRDPLTGIANRAMLYARLEEMFACPERHGEAFAVLCLDLDRFKAVNDSLGHTTGDALLKQVASRLLDCTRGNDIVARVGGDEFVIVQSNLEDAISAIPLVHRLLTEISAPYELNTQRLSIGTSIGIAVAPGDGQTPELILRHADLALYRAKADGRGAFCFFEPEMQTAAEERLRLETEIRTALERDQFELLYLPWISCETGRIAGCEALVRWHHPTRGMIGPADFVPVAEECGLIGSLGQWVLNRATREAGEWPDHVKLSVNVSAAQFLGNDLPGNVMSALAASGLAPERLELEVTESAVLFERGDQRANLQQLRRHGIQIAIDDFGTGYSSFRYLSLFPFDRIKIHREFVAHLEKRRHCTSIVAAIVGLGQSLDIQTTAVGIENERQFAHLKASGCTAVQGFLFGEPCRAEDVPGLVSKFATWHTAA